MKSTLFDDVNWHNADFEQARRNTKNKTLSDQYAKLEASWWEQRHWGITVFLQTLLDAQHPLGDSILHEFRDLAARVPNNSGFVPVKVKVATQQRFVCGTTEISFDRTGAISHLVVNGTVWAQSGHALMQLKYRSYSAADVSNFLENFCHSNASWIQHDYGKPGLPPDVQGKIWVPSLKALFASEGHDDHGRQCSFLLQTAFEPEASSMYGAAAGWTRVNIDATTGDIDVAVNMFNKSTTRLPEAMFVQILPPQASSAGTTWEVNKLGTWVDIQRDVVKGGTKHLHGIEQQPSLRIIDSNQQQMSITALDAAVLNVGELTAYPAPVDVDANVSAYGASFLLWDNL
eukprot:COSAG02_NODE_8059_length_2728_cov_2.497528_2_plen_345_part_00